MIDYDISSVEITQADCDMINAHVPELAAEGLKPGNVLRADVLRHVRRVAAEKEREAKAKAIAAAEALAKPAPARAAPRPPLSEVGKSMVADGHADAGWLSRSPSRDECYSNFETLAEAIREVAARVTEIEKAGVHYRGTFQRALAYERGDMATHSGSLWACLKTTEPGTIPGSNPEHWQLAAKDTGR